MKIQFDKTSQAEIIVDSARDENKPINLSKLMAALTLQEFAEIGFGVEVDCLTPGQVHPFQEAFDNSTRSVMTRFFRPRRSIGSNKDNENVVSLFLDSSDENPDMNHLKDIVLARLAGYTSQTLFWFFVMLSRHPEVERKIRVETKDKLLQLFHSEEAGAAPTVEEKHTRVLLPSYALGRMKSVKKKVKPGAVLVSTHTPMAHFASLC
ncbi:hypothetical protein Gpo141_00008089 [Globisporangium polare]